MKNKKLAACFIHFTLFNNTKINSSQFLFLVSGNSYIIYRDYLIKPLTYQKNKHLEKETFKIERNSYQQEDFREG